MAVHKSALLHLSMTWSLRPLRITALLLFFLLMVGLGSIPGQAHALSDRFGDKLLHVLAYGLMTAISFGAIVARPRWQAMISIMLIALLGLIDESIQSFLPYRNASLLDWCFDIASAILVAMLLLLFSFSESDITSDTETHAQKNQ